MPQTGISVTITVLKFLPFIEVLIAKLSRQELRGAWCTCWQAEKETNIFQAGTMELNQVFGTVWGTIYSADERWPIRARYKAGSLVGTYETKSGQLGTFQLRYSDDAVNRDRLHGSWSGLVKYEDTGAERVKHGLLMAASRHESVIKKCIMRAETGDQHCRQ